MRIFFALLLYILPADVARAQVTLNSIIEEITGVISNLVPLAVGVALLVFVWGVVRMIAGMSMGESDKAITDGKKRMMWGVVALFVIVSVWGIVSILNLIFFGEESVDQTGNPPQILSQ